jgi:hypothetical protein
MSTIVPPASSTTGKRDAVLLHAVSYKSRALESLRRTVDRFIIRNAMVTEFNVRDYLAEADLEFWKAAKRDTLDYLAEMKIPFTLLETRDDDFNDYFARIKREIDRKNTVVIDVTTFPNNYVLKICEELEGYNVMYQYTRGQRPGVQGAMFTEEERDVGVSKIIAIEGFKGQVTINAGTLLVLVLGFESNRALAFLNALVPQRALALIGSPNNGVQKESEFDRMYIDGAREANKLLLSNSFVREVQVNSILPQVFQRQLTDIIQAELNGNFSDNVVIVPVGTKAQTLGLYLYWKKNPRTQILYPVPNRRPRIALGTGETCVYDREGDLLREYSWIDSVSLP